MIKKRFRLIIHGGAWNIPEEMEEHHLEGIRNALIKGKSLLEKGCSSLDVVEKVVNILEEDPTFDAGRGSFLNSVGEVEMDALIMDGSNLNLGAVAGVGNILNPISLARLIMEKSEHCLLIGDGALSFGDNHNFPRVQTEDLLTEREKLLFEKIRLDPNFKPQKPFGFDDSKPSDTVGAVVLDSKGNIAAGTSTGGTPLKLKGRVGDSPLPGAGAYAWNPQGGSSATGWGESIMKVLLTKTFCDFLPMHSAMNAAEKSIQILKTRANGLGGLIGISSSGEYGWAYNTPKMAFGYLDENNEIVVKIKN
jgi:L-asparaginase / beta-aspartyl-peptidase